MSASIWRILASKTAKVKVCQSLFKACCIIINYADESCKAVFTPWNAHADESFGDALERAFQARFGGVDGAAGHPGGSKPSPQSHANGHASRAKQATSAGAAPTAAAAERADTGDAVAAALDDALPDASGVQANGSHSGAGTSGAESAAGMTLGQDAVPRADSAAAEPPVNVFDTTDHQRISAHCTADPSAKLGDQPLAQDTPMEPATDQDPADEAAIPPPANILAEAAAPAVAPPTPLSDMDQEEDTAEAEAYERAAAAAPGFEPPTELEVKAEAAAAAHEEQAAQQVATSAIKVEDAETVALLPDPLQNGTKEHPPSKPAVLLPKAEALPPAADASERDASAAVKMEHSNGDLVPLKHEQPAYGAAAADTNVDSNVAVAEAISGPGAAGGASAAAGGSDATKVVKAEGGADVKQPEPQLPQFLTKDEQRLLDWHWANLEYGCSARLSEARCYSALLPSIQRSASC